MKTKYHFTVPDQKRIRMIVHTDCRDHDGNECYLFIENNGWDASLCMDGGSRERPDLILTCPKV